MTIAHGRLALRELLDQVDDARARLQRLRSAPEPKRADVAAAQQAFRHALEAYASAAEVHRLPLPHRLRVELIVYRSLEHEA